MNNFKKYFDISNGKEFYKKPSECAEKNEFYFGVDDEGCPSMLFYYKGLVMPISSSMLIQTNIFKKNKNEYVIKFTLKNQAYFEQFEKVCSDIITYCNNKDGKIHTHVVNRWEAWRKLFTNYKKDILSESTIKGLIGEMSEIIKLSDQGKDMNIIIDAWCGPEKNKQDFIFENYWIEVKSSLTSSDVVKISSVEQLDSQQIGYLELFELEKVTTLSQVGTNLNKLNSEICKRITDNVVLDKYFEKISSIGYIHQKVYDEFNYLIIHNYTYKVDESFGCLRRKDLPDTIRNAKYEIYKNQLDEWKV